MVNYLNVIMGFMAFFGSSALSYGLHNLVFQIISYFPAFLFVLCSVAWVYLEIMCILVLPSVLVLADDGGN